MRVQIPRESPAKLKRQDVDKQPIPVPNMGGRAESTLGDQGSPTSPLGHSATPNVQGTKEGFGGGGRQVGEGRPRPSGLCGQRGDAPPSCPGQLLFWSQGLKPEPLSGGGAAALAWKGGGSCAGWELGNTGVPGTQALPVRQLLLRLAAFGESYSPTSHAPRMPPATGLPEGGPTPPGARDPQSGRWMRPHPMYPSLENWGLLLIQDSIPTRGRRTPSARPNSGTCALPLELPRFPRRPLSLGQELRGTPLLPPPTPGR